MSSLAGLPRPIHAVPRTAGAHLSRDVPVAAPGDRAGDIRRSLVGRRFDSANDVVVLDGFRLLGLIRLEDLLAADEPVTAAELMDADPPAIAHGVTQEVAAWRAVQHRESSLAVVDDDGRFQGLIPPWRMLGVLLEEHEEDLARLAGFVRGAREAGEARSASREAVLRRLRHRLPWLLLGLAGALVAAGIVGAFEGTIAATPMIAYFVPGIVYMADAVGTQTEALIIRGLSVGVPVGDVVRRELLTGLLVGIILGLAFLPPGILLWGRTDLAVAVALALFAACSTATVVAMALPALLHRLGTDPAFGSGPLATVVQDLLSILIYFAIATRVAG
jgi:magnesium transporter